MDEVKVVIAGVGTVGNGVLTILLKNRIQLDKKLGFPSQDPHGSPIPPKLIAPKRPLLNIKLGTKAFIAKEQISDQVESELWELGLLPDSAITLVKVEKDVVKVKYQGRPLVIRSQLAGLINTKR